MRIYLDTNILTKLSDHYYLNKLIIEYGEYVNLIYSEAHIDDLSRSNDPIKTRSDLETIRDLTHSQCIAKYMKDEEVTYQTRNPIEFYETSQEVSLTPTTLARLDDEFRNIDFAALGVENPIPQLNKALADFNQTVLDKLGTQEFDYSQLFKSSLQNLSMQSLITDMMNLINGSPESKEFYQHARSLMEQHIKGRIELSNEKEPIDYLNEFLPKSIFGKSFDDFVDMGMKIGNTNLGKQGEKELFVTNYSNLDLMGFRADSKMSVQNINTDATHAYFGGHCDVFITQDKKLKAKAETLYKKFGTETIVLNVKEACKALPRLIPKSDTVEELIDEIVTHGSLLVKKYYSDITDKTTTIVRLLGNFLLGFFDENMHHIYQDGGFISVYYKSTPTLSKWYYKREYELLTNKLFSMLGVDKYGNGSFLAWSTEFSIEDDWRGRYWGNSSSIVLKHTDDFGITLFVTNKG